MCNLSEMIEESGIAKGIEQGIISLVMKNLLPNETAAEELGITMEELEQKLENYSTVGQSKE